jgi:hypothetical protein
MTNINPGCGHLNSVSAKIDNGNGTVGALVNDKALYNNLNQTASGARGGSARRRSGINRFPGQHGSAQAQLPARGYFKNRGYEDSSDLGKDEIESVPQSSTLKDFTFQAKGLFDKQDSAKLKGQKALKAAGEFLAGQRFWPRGHRGIDRKDAVVPMRIRRWPRAGPWWCATIWCSTSDSTTPSSRRSRWESRAMRFQGRLGLVKILIYPPGTPVPPDKSRISRQTTNPRIQQFRPRIPEQSSPPLQSSGPYCKRRQIQRE